MKPSSPNAILSALHDYQARYPAEAATVAPFLDLLEEWPACLRRSRTAGHLTASAFVTGSFGRDGNAEGNAERNAERKAKENGAGDLPSEAAVTHVLLVLHRKLRMWLQPGGHADGTEDLVQVARAELAEETGVSNARLVSPLPFDIDLHEIPARPGVPGHYHYDVRYHFSALARSPLVVSHESHAVQWVPIADLAAYTTEESILRMVRKLH